MPDQSIPILLNMLAALAGAFGQYFYKKGGELIANGSPWWNVQIFIGILMFCLVMGFFVVGYKMGGRISVVYPFYATTFIWGALIGVLMEKEPWNWLLISGVGIVVFGVCVMAFSLGRAS